MNKEQMIQEMLTHAFNCDFVGAFENESEYQLLSDILAEYGLSHLYSYDPLDGL